MHNCDTPDRASLSTGKTGQPRMFGFLDKDLSMIRSDPGATPARIMSLQTPEPNTQDRGSRAPDPLHRSGLAQPARTRDLWYPC